MKATNDLPKDGEAFISRFCAIYIPGDTYVRPRPCLSPSLD